MIFHYGGLTHDRIALLMVGAIYRPPATKLVLQTGHGGPTTNDVESVCNSAAAIAVSTAFVGSAHATDPVTAAISAAAIDHAKANIEGAKDESGVIDKAVKATTGISIKDIKKDGIFGGSNSFFRKPFG